MVRTSPSPADRTLAALSARHGVQVSARHLERWRSHPLPLLPSHRRDYPGQPTGGSSSTADERLVDLVVWLARNRRPGTSRGHLALRAFGDGLPVPEQTVREVFVRGAKEMATELRRGFGEPPEDCDLQEWVYDRADALAADRERRPGAAERRLQTIDRRVQTLLGSAVQAFAAKYDPRAAEAESLDRTDRLYHASVTAMAGPGELTPDTIARYARGLVPPGMPQWPARLLETDPGDPLAALTTVPVHRLPGLPENSAANHLYAAALDAPLDQVRAAWTVAGQVPAWAESTCAAVEGALDGGRPDDVLGRWATGMVFPVDRPFLTIGLAEPYPTLGQQVRTALNVLVMVDAINTVLRVTDDDGRTTMRLLSPPFLLPLLEVD
ncbi:hypothetical protein ACFC58_03380 [Kitasatospora purpeofusca]|uniref:hypothetical protein n=1 Tax=Kitasatospora purpeofusca TaxID=67352 RepID=UPI0035DA5A10